MNPLLKAFFIFCASVPGITQACLWDSDTLASERARFPEVQGTMTGQFPRHSKEYHAWRVQQKLPLVESGKAVASDYDDLAVSLHKLGSHQSSIDIMMAKEKKMPGQYETYSNLGTFYIYTGDLPTAQLWIEKALTVNANAHFGREKYQLWLVMWLLQKRSGDKSPADHDKERVDYLRGRPSGFAKFVARKELGEYSGRTTQTETLNEDQRKAAIGGVTGMMYFADFDNPVLLEALGDLLSFGSRAENASHLAGLCYLLASEGASDADEKVELKSRMMNMMQTQRDLDEGKLRTALAK